METNKLNREIQYIIQEFSKLYNKKLEEYGKKY